VSGQAYGQYADTFNEQALLASAAQQDKLEQRLHTADGRPSYRNSARVSRAFELEPLKSLDNAHDGNCLIMNGTAWAIHVLRAWCSAVC
jgi:hypothetical protein